MNIKDYHQEDLTSSQDIDTTVTDLEKSAADWVEQAAKKTHAVSGSTYVKLDRGVMTVDQLDAFLKALPLELSFVDENNQFLYYNQQMSGDKMLAKRFPQQVGNPLSEVHPPQALEHVKQVVNKLRQGQETIVKLPVPGYDENHFEVHYYGAMHDKDGAYRGINEWVVDLMPTIKWYLQQTGQKLVPDENKTVDTTTGASQQLKTQESEQPDANTGASQHQ
ncbi:PAS domain-containing protein [Bombilactobacillus bombi]|uniref:PAS domain-containing protein n=1 Tax=Bombilactobacillus bombi TaxID=1303590 RepID=UPI0015E62322|nr:PAS domain-containing protein [Bombilactobacillus bombi]MBA1393586.1 NADPH-dependent FMN reductase [Lactobacillus sp. XV13L]MBA1433823.1 NADPH-dependent FMN reductase [Bombilactobacillus bombi]